MKLDLERTPRGKTTLSVNSVCDLGYEAAGPQKVQIAGEVRVDNLEGHCIVRGELTAQGPVLCDRCQQEFVFAFPVGVQLMILRQVVGPRDVEDEDGDTAVLYQRDGIVDLSEFLREAAVLALPISRLCRMDCRGLCIHCGVDLNEADCVCEDDEPDPRWAGLPTG